MNRFSKTGWIVAVLGLGFCALPCNVSAQDSGKESQAARGSTGDAQQRMQAEMTRRLLQLEKENLQLRKILRDRANGGQQESESGSKTKRISNFLKEKLRDKKSVKELIATGKDVASEVEREVQRLMESKDLEAEREQLLRLASDMKQWSAQQKEAIEIAARKKAADMGIKEFRASIEESIYSEMPRLEEILMIGQQKAKELGVEFDREEVEKVKQLAKNSVSKSLDILEGFAFQAIGRKPGETVDVMEFPLRSRAQNSENPVDQLKAIKQHRSPEVRRLLEEAIRKMESESREHSKESASRIKTEAKVQQVSGKKLSFMEKMKRKAAAAKKKIEEELDKPID